MTLIR